MSDDAFIDAILAAPDDDAPRLVYADVLVERGDPRGEFIIVQCARAKVTRGTRADHELARREAELYAANVKSWVNPVGLKGWWGTYERGFITHLSNLTMRGTRQRWDAFFGRMPLASMGFRTFRPDAVLSELAWVVKRATLPISFSTAANTRFATYDAALLREALADGGNGEVVCPLNGNTHPRLWPATIEMGGAAVVAADFREHDWPHLRALTMPGLGQLALEDLRTFRVRLAALPELTQFEARLLTSAAAEAILRGPRPPRLRALVIAHEHLNAFAPAVTRALIESPLLPQLESLRIDVAFDDVVVEKLAGDAKALRRLVLDRGPISRSALGALARSPLASRLEELTLVVRDQSSAEALLDAPFERLRSLTLDGFTITGGVASAIVDGLPTVNELRVKNASMRASAEAILRERWPGVT